MHWDHGWAEGFAFRQLVVKPMFWGGVGHRTVRDISPTKHMVKILRKDENSKMHDIKELIIT